MLASSNRFSKTPPEASGLAPASAALGAPTLERGPRKATVLQLVFMTYAVVCSGAYGVEQMVSAAGPGLALLVLLVLPVVYSVPISLACAELTARFPVEGGYYRWARMAYGDFAGYTSGWLMWLASFATNASVAVLFSNYLRHFTPGLSAAGQVLVSAAVVWFAVVMNYRGISFVGTASVVFTVLILVPFGVMTLMGLMQWQHMPVQPFANPDVPLATAALGGLLIAMWLYGGFEKMTVTAEEVDRPSRSFPIALAIAVPLCASSYVLPTLAALAAHGNWREWGEAHYVTAAATIGGPWLGAAMAAGALLSNVGILMATILTQSRLPMVLAEDGLFPRAFERRHPRFGTPVVSLLVAGVILTALCTLPFAHLVGAAALVQSLSYLLVYAALLKLRARPDKDGRRGFRIPLGRAGLSLMAAPSVLIVSLVIWAGLFPDGRLDGQQGLLGLALLGSAPLTYRLLRRDARLAPCAVSQPATHSRA
ncbi:MAG: APC family permease [Vicinamibacterales bacterium]